MLRIAPAVVVSLAVLLFPGQGRAQLELRPAIGLTFTDVSQDPAGGEAQGRVGWQLGGTVAYGKKLYVEGGAFYAKKSTEFSSSTPDPDLTTSLSGIRIPVTIGYHLLGSEKNPFGLRLFGGGSAFFVTSVDAPGLTEDDFESPTYGVFAGAGVDIMIFFLDLQYEWSLTDVSSVSTVDVGQSRSFYANAGVRIPF
jgi:hypothetical protein